jgi:serine/threonine protein kinase
MSGPRKHDDDPLIPLTATDEGVSKLPAGHIVANRYEIRNKLGKGGMGVIYLAHDRMLDEPIALKLLREEVAQTEGMDERFRSEIRLARKVTHRNVCRIYEYGEDGRIRYISMELIEGRDLRDRLDDYPAGLEPLEAFTVSLQIAEGLEAIHDVGIIHRDLKTPNVMIDERGRIRLMDFGIAKHTDELTPSGLTQAGIVMGTPEYMSPEQCRGQQLDFRTDIYSLGIVLYEVFTGDVPFQAETPMSTVLLQVQRPLSFDTPGGERIPRPIQTVLTKMLAKERDDRYSTVGEALDGLRRARSEFLAEAQEREAKTASDSGEWPQVDRRGGGDRSEIYVNALIKRLAPDGRVLQEERTIAENISRGGAQVMTSMSGIQPGDTVLFAELGGQFTSRAEVRNSYRGRDNVHRLNLKFVDLAPYAATRASTR